MPIDEGASGKARSDVTALVPIVRMRGDVAAALAALPVLDQVSVRLEAVPARERDFKRLFDEFSDAVSYKQRFLDANAFLVWECRATLSEGHCRQ